MQTGNGFQPGAVVQYLSEFSSALRWQVTAFGSYLRIHSDLPQPFKERLDVSINKVVHHVDIFRTELFSAVSADMVPAGFQCEFSQEPNRDPPVYKKHVITLDEPFFGLHGSNGQHDSAAPVTNASLAGIEFLPQHAVNKWLGVPNFPTKEHDTVQPVKQISTSPICSISSNDEARTDDQDSAKAGLQEQPSDSQASDIESARCVPDAAPATQNIGEKAAETEDDAVPVERQRTRQSTCSDESLRPDLSDMELRDEIEDEEDEPSGACVDGVFNPNYPGRLAWDLNTMLLVLCDAMILPFQMAYKGGDNPDEFDVMWLWLTTTFFACDVVLNFFTAYQAGRRDTDYEPGKLVTMRRRIARNYMRSWLAIDVVSTVPWGVLAALILGGGSGSAGQLGKLTKVVKFVRFMRLMRMLRLAKLATIWERVEAKCGSILLLQGVSLIRVLFVLVCICHWNACIWWMIGKPESIFTELLSDEAQQEWKRRPHWTTIVRSDSPSGPQWTWISRSEQSRFQAYIFCFYWTLGVMRTMPAEVTPVSQPERIYIMVFMFFAFSAFAICVAQITQTFFKFSERKRVFNDDMAAVRMHLRKLKVSDPLQTKIKTYIRHLWESRDFDAREQRLLAYLPPQHKKELEILSKVPLVEKFTIFQDLSAKAFTLVSDIADIRNNAPGDFVCEAGRRAVAAYALGVGRWRIHSEHSEHTQESDQTKTKVSIVDEECLLTEETYRSKYTVISMTASQCLKIDRKRFLEKTSSLKDFWHKVRKESSQRSHGTTRSRLSRQYRGMSSRFDTPEDTDRNRRNSTDAATLTATNVLVGS